MSNSKTVNPSGFKRTLNQIKIATSIYWWSIKNITRKCLVFVGRFLTTPFYLVYGIFWTFMLLVKMIGIIMSLSFYRASIPQWQLEIGRIFLIHGANLQVGQPVRFKKERNGKILKRWVANLHYDFRNNKINTTYQDKPIPKLSDRFKDK